MAAKKIMENELFKKRYGEIFKPAILQEDFNDYVRRYNEDYSFFFQRVASGNYDSLINSAGILKGFYEMVVFMQQATGSRFEVMPLTFTSYHESKYYRALGFNDDEIRNIHGFFDHVKETFNKCFEECTSEDLDKNSNKKYHWKK